MDFDLYKKHGEYNKDKYYIIDHKKWDYFSNNPKLYKRKKRISFAFLLIPIVGIILMDMVFSEMGLSIN